MTRLVMEKKVYISWFQKDFPSEMKRISEYRFAQRKQNICVYVHVYVNS